MFLAFFEELRAGHLEVEAAGDRAGLSLMRFEALNWRERLSRVVELERRCGNDQKVKGVQAMMGRLAEAESNLRMAKRYSEEVRHDDALYWLMALYPIGRR